MRSGEEEAQMTGRSSSGVAPIGDGGAPIIVPELIIGVSILGAIFLAVSSRVWSPGSSAKSAQTSLMFLSSIRTIMIVNPGPVLQALRTMPISSLTSDGPSYICTGLALRAQPSLSNPTTIRQPSCHGDALMCRIVIFPPT